MNSDSHVTALIADWVSGLASRLPETVAHRARRSLLDWLALNASAAEIAEVTAIADHWAARDSGGPSRVLFRNTKTSPLTAAYLNAGAVHTTWLMDGIFGVFNGGSAIVAAAFAAAEETDAPLELLLEAIVAGYEVGGGLALAVNRLPDSTLQVRRGVPPVAACGAIAAAAAAAVVYRLSREQIAAALSLAAVASGGLLTRNGEDYGASWLLSAGLAARHGLEAAQLAAAGLRGNPAALGSGEGGFFHGYGSPADELVFRRAFGQGFLVEQYLQTTHGTFLHLHPYLGVVRDGRERGLIPTPKHIRWIRCNFERRQWLMHQTMLARSNTTIRDIRASVAHAAALELTIGESLLPTRETLRVLESEAARHIIDKFRPQESPGLRLWPPQPDRALFEIECVDGRIVTLVSPHGEHAAWINPDDSALIEKAVKLLHDQAPATHLREAGARVLNSPGSTPVRQISLLARQGVHG